ncbi:hypothetical protein [Veillonella agrestimuris]|uniref:hypothetical protein n=1 Tax=Veillonella agrestimuris TaxID=2941340 RepID=UPI00204019A3|nr:hypothetical protein [Veillonella agrestimuris]
MGTEKETNRVMTGVESDYNDVVSDIAEELVARLNVEEDGTIIDMFQTGSFDPWQLFVFYSALEKALMSFRTDKRKKTVIVHAQPEALVGTGPVVMPVSTMVEHICMSRMNDLSEGRLETGLLTVSSESIDYEGVNLKGRYVVIICDIHDHESPYLSECIRLCKEMKASHVVAVPLMVWNPDLIDHLTEESIKADLSYENRTLS